jgi:hypothetical protein
VVHGGFDVSTDAPLRAREATSRASVILARTAELAAVSTTLSAEVERSRIELARRRLALHDSRRSLAATLAKRTTIEVSGTIDGVDVSATWIDGRLTGSPELIRRAEMLVAMGEHLTSAHVDHSDDEEADAGATRRYTASLAGPPTIVALTLMRACTRVRSVDIPVGP